MTITRKGCTRIVILWRGYAVKLPNFADGWKLFLKGLLANMQEAAFSKAGWPELCPVLLGVPGGWLLVMRRARPLTREEFDSLDLEAWVDRGDYVVPAEIKMDSFGYIGSQLVAVDYGN